MNIPHETMPYGERGSIPGWGRNSIANPRPLAECSVVLVLIKRAGLRADGLLIRGRY